MIVVDLQGMADPEKDRYALTDPAIHHESLSKFFNSGSNFGAAWMTTSSSMSSHVVHKFSFHTRFRLCLLNNPPAAPFFQQLIHILESSSPLKSSLLALPLHP